MKRSICIALMLLCANSSLALAWDPYRDDLGPDMWTEPDPVPFVVPDGIYLVTEVYAGDRVTDDGRTTTYTTDTVNETPGTYARVLETVGTGAASGFDGAAFNGRATMPDGRPVAGTYYEDFVLTAQGFVSVNVVFFQDDSATRGSTATTPRPSAATSTPPPTPRPTVENELAERRPSGSPPPRDRREDRGVAEERDRSVAAGVALGPSAPILGSIEVLRGRSVSLWPRAFANGSAVPVRSWRLVSGTPPSVSATTAGGPGPCVVAWSTLPSPGSAFAVRFDVTTDLGTAPATVLVYVRSPALLQ